MDTLSCAEIQTEANVTKKDNIDLLKNRLLYLDLFFIPGRGFNPRMEVKSCNTSYKFINRNKFLTIFK